MKTYGMGFDLINFFPNCVCYYNYYNLTTIGDPKNWNWKKLVHRSILEEKKKNNGSVCIEGGWWAQWGKEKNFILNTKYPNVVQSIEFWLAWIINGGGGIIGKLGMMLCKKARNNKGGAFNKKYQEMVEQETIVIVGIIIFFFCKQHFLLHTIGLLEFTFSCARWAWHPWIWCRGQILCWICY